MSDKITFMSEEDTDDIEYISTGSKVIDNVLNGGFPTKAVSGVFSRYDLGKTILCTQTACKLWSEEKLGTIYIDTESHYVRSDVRNKFLDIFKERFGFDDDPQIGFLFPEDIFELGELFGKQIQIVSEPGARKKKIFINDTETVSECKIARLLEDGDYGCIVIDSLSLPVKEEIQTPPQQNFPSRSAALNCILGRVSPLTKKFNLAGITTLHESENPANKYDTGKFFGGEAVGFHEKYMLQIRGKGKNPSKGEERYICPYRFPGKQSKNTKADSEEVKLAKDVGFTP